MTDSKLRAAARKPAAIIRSERKAAMGLPPEFPLFPQGSGRWAKKIRGKLHYFGKVADDPKGTAALKLWLEQKDDLLAGFTPRGKKDGLTLAELCNKYLKSKRTDVDTGRLSSRTFVGYSQTTDTLIDAFGRDRLVLDLRPEDFEKLYSKLAKKHGFHTLGREITICRGVFKYAVESDLIDRAVKFGPKFRGPTKSDKRKARAKKKQQRGACMFTADEIKTILDAAGPQLKAMVLLGINAAFGNTDCATLPVSALDLKNGWLDFARPKTGIDRRVPLWPETIAALKAVLAARKRPADEAHAGLVFLTRLGQPWVRFALSETPNEDGKLEVTLKADDAIAKSMAKLLKDLGIYRKGVAFYALRHSFETVAGGCRDQVAVDAVMGHVDATMAAEYREDIDEERLKAVVEHVHGWLFPKKAKQNPAASDKAKKKAPPRKENREPAALRVVG
jgi:integrase